MLLTAVVILSSAFTGSTCAAIDNRTNTAVWAHGRKATRAHYRELDRLIYRPAPAPNDNAGWRALHAAERGIQQGTAGPKIHVACVR